MDQYDRKIIVAVCLIAFYLLLGTIVFHVLEGWRFLDAFYFSGTTLTTVGYGDLHPTKDVTKIVAVFFMFSGIGIVFYSISIIAQKTFAREEERLQAIWSSTQERRVQATQPIVNVTRRLKRIPTDVLRKKE
jgi:TRAP-type mannitol/chloroaromatic compound transport system permease small subunit